MRYVIVSVVDGKAGILNDNLRREVFQKFGAKSSKLPAHFTIKAPFEYGGSIDDLEIALEIFSKESIGASYGINNYDHFDLRVIYMKVEMSVEGKELHDKLIDTIDSLPYIAFDNKDGKNKIFHVTIASKKINDIYPEIWEYVNTKPCSFQCKFNNVSIYKWQENTWLLHKKYEF
ncbi:2'-5' RNA ligase family protein [Clostridium estertheticum]|uniref:2'-5' RNA ligase family protein n=1 Tax=Clostridium estertheticum TaxID=238834 RepID=UPI0013E8FD1B|nr:2'-5' RNA ligase family protein [Clostridium estertheticum]MBZ9688207.1 2'-5' RNA ligase family protein [Clostridium estertheticum]